MSTNTTKNTKTRRRNNKRSYNKIENQIETHLMNKKLLNEYNNVIKQTPTVLIELTSIQWKRIKDNSIHVSDAFLSETDVKNKREQTIFYNSIYYGKNLQKQKSDISFNLGKKNGGKMKCIMLNHSRIKKRMLYITTNRNEIKTMNPNHHIISSNATSTSSLSFQNSGKVLLFVLNSSINTKKDKNCYEFSEKDYKELVRFKPNIIKPKNDGNHFQSQGYIASFGNKGYYGMVNSTSSVSQFVNKKSECKVSQENIDRGALNFEKICSDQLESSLGQLEAIFPNISNIICPILNVVNQIETNTVDLNLKKQQTGHNGLWQSSICVNAVTKLFHIERDVTYTLITVPKQKTVKSGCKKTRETFFQFKLNNDNCIAIPMINQTSFIFSGTMLTHRQFSMDGYMNKKKRESLNPYFNIASYGNEKLFRHIRTSLNRNIK